jgi:hypothetical protein
MAGSRYGTSRAGSDTRRCPSTMKYAHLDEMQFAGMLEVLDLCAQLTKNAGADPTQECTMKLTKRVFVLSLALAATIGIAQAQAPKPVSIEEQVRQFNSLSPEQQRTLINEVRQKLPPEQAEKVIAVLQGVNRTPTEPRPVAPPVN